MPAPPQSSRAAARSANRLPRVGRSGQWAARGRFKARRRWSLGRSEVFESGSGFGVPVLSLSGVSGGFRGRAGLGLCIWLCAVQRKGVSARERQTAGEGFGAQL